MTNSKIVTPNAGWPVYTLLGRWSRSGWSVLSGRSYQGARSVLRGLADAITDARDSRSSVKITVWQLSERAGLSERWTGFLLGYLERLGLITWWRGRIINGKAVPSRITIQRQRLAALVRDALHLGDKKDCKHVADVAARIAKMGTPRFMVKKPKSHVELDSIPHPLRGVVAAPTGARSQKDPRRGRGVTPSPLSADVEKHLPDECHHLVGEPSQCRHCRIVSITAIKSATGAGIRESVQPVAAQPAFDLAKLVAEAKQAAREGARQLTLGLRQ